MKRKNKNYKNFALGALFFANAIWGFNSIFTKIGVAEIPNTTFVALRFAGVCLIILPFAVRAWRPISRKTFWILVLSSILSFIYALLYAIGLKWTTATNSAILMLLYPMVLALLSSRILREKISGATVAGILVAVAGAAVIINGSWSGSGLVGDLVILLGVFVSALQTIVLKSAINGDEELPIPQLVFMVNAPGAAFAIIFAIFSGGLIAPSASVGAWDMLALSILCISVAGPLFQWGLKKVPAHQTGPIGLTQNIMIVVAAWLILGEKLTFATSLGAILVALGVYLAQFSRKRN